jgi:hypothetical protein
MAFMGYDAESGAVAMYTLSVTATSPPGTPPLFALPVWSHEWAKGWVRFAFFQLGGSNFFLKTNKLDKRVNIDHVVDGIAGGTWEVAPAMQDQLPDNQILKFVQSFYFENGDPYFVTYKVDGTICFYRFWGNCQGFDLMASAKGPPDANCLTLFQTERSNVLLLLS